MKASQLSLKPWKID